MIVDSSIGIQQEIPSNFTIPYNFIVSHNRGNISIGYTIPFSSRIKLESFDIQGRLVSTLVDAYKQAGKYTINFDLNKHSAGVYYIRLSMGNESIVRKAILLK